MGKNIFIKNRKKVMRIAMLFFITISIFSNTLNTYGNETSKDSTLTIDKNLTIRELFELISSKTGYDFFYNSELKELTKKIFIRVEKAPVSKVLNIAFKGLSLEYTIKGNDIIIRKNINTQKRIISGIVRDDTGIALPDVSIRIQNTKIGTVTDFDGKFSLEVSSSDVLEFSYLGFKNKKVQVGDKSYFEIVLVLENNMLDEIIVAGVASGTKKKLMSVSVAKLNADDLNEVPQTSVASSLSGKVPGVTVTSFGGSPGSSPNIVLRGSTNITGNNTPMILVDGVILQGSLADINIDDMESIEVVKGASASSLYGSRAANGVLVITSKRGSSLKEGKTSVTIRSEFGIQQISKYLDLSTSHHYQLSPDWLDAETFTKYYFVNYPDGYETGWDPNIIGNRVEKEDRYQDMPYRVNNNLQKEMFTNGEYLTNYASVGHRVNKTNIFLSFEKNENRGVIIETEGYKRQSFRMNIDHNISDNLKISASNNYIKTSNDFLGGGTQAFFEVLMTDPDVNLFADNVDGQKYNFYPNQWNTQFANPLYDLWDKESDSQKTRFLGSYSLEWKIADWIKFEGSYAFETQDYQSTDYTPKGTILDLLADETASGTVIKPQYSDGALTKYNSIIDNNNNNSVRATLSFNKKWEDLAFNGKLSYLNENNHFESVSTSGTGFTLPNLPSLQYIKNENISATDYVSDEKAVNYFAIASFVYKNRYILDGLFRIDGSSLFGEKERWQNYFRVSGAYRLTEDLKIKNVEELKLRVAYGTSGLRPAFSSQYETFNVNDGSFSKSTLGNKYLKPSRSSELEIGLETSFLDRFSFEATYSKTNVTDQYLLAPLPVHAGGYPNQWVNAGELESNTFEAMLNTKIISNDDFSWNLAVTFDRTRQKITKLKIPEYSTGPRSAFRIREGEVFGSMYGVDFVRTLDQMSQQLSTGDDIANYIVNRDGVVVKQADLGTIDEKPFMVLDENGAEKNVKIGDINPDFRLGINTTFKYKGFSAYMLWQWKNGGEIYNGTAQYLVRDNRHPMIDQIHTKPEDKKTVNYYQSLYDAQALNGFWVEDASYLRLNEASISYKLDKKDLGSAADYIESIKFSMLGRNLLTITDYSGYDPESGYSGFLFDNFGYPNFSSYSFSVELKF
jgi:TonB-linked SusC/RagA family outer membrane protein